MGFVLCCSISRSSSVGSHGRTFIRHVKSRYITRSVPFFLRLVSCSTGVSSGGDHRCTGIGTRGIGSVVGRFTGPHCGISILGIRIPVVVSFIRKCNSNRPICAERRTGGLFGRRSRTAGNIPCVCLDTKIPTGIFRSALILTRRTNSAFGNILYNHTA